MILTNLKEELALTNCNGNCNGKWLIVNHKDSDKIFAVLENHLIKVYCRKNEKIKETVTVLVRNDAHWGS